MSTLRALLLSSTLALVACPKGPLAPPPPPPPPPSPLADATTGPADVSAADKGSNDAIRELVASLQQEVTLIDAGAEPRQPLQFSPQPGKVDWTLRMLNAISMEMTLPDGTEKAQALPSPPIVTSYSTQLDPGEAAGTYRMTSTVTDILVEAPAEDPMAMAMAQQLDPMKGLSVVAILDEKGAVTDLEFDAEQGMPGFEELASTLTQQVKSSQVPLPKEPVGPGAQWKVMSDTQLAGGMDTTVESIYTLVSRTEDSAELSYALTMELAGEMQLPNLPPEAKLTVDRFEMTGSGTSTVSLTSLVSTGTIDMVGELVCTIALPDGNSLGMRMVMDMDMELAPGSAE